jgi:hypothetical protein
MQQIIQTRVQSLRRKSYGWLTSQMPQLGTALPWLRKVATSDDLPTESKRPGWHPGMVAAVAPAIDSMAWLRRSISADVAPSDAARQPGWQPGMVAVAPPVVDSLAWLQRQRAVELLPLDATRPVAGQYSPQPAYGETLAWLRRTGPAEPIPADVAPRPGWHPGESVVQPPAIEQLAWVVPRIRGEFPADTPTTQRVNAAVLPPIEYLPWRMRRADADTAQVVATSLPSSATLISVLDRIDARVVTLWPSWSTLQTTFAGSHSGRYFQGLRTHSVLPADGATVAADQLATHPSYQAETWVDFGIAAFSEIFALEMYEYIGPAGNGWLAIFRVKILGTEWMRIKGSAAEYRDLPWYTTNW